MTLFAEDFPEKTVKPGCKGRPEPGEKLFLSTSAFEALYWVNGGGDGFLAGSCTWTRVEEIPGGGDTLLGISEGTGLSYP